MGIMYGAAIALALLTVLAAAKLRKPSPSGYEDSFLQLIAIGNAISVADVLVNGIAPSLLLTADSVTGVSGLYELLFVPLAAVDAVAYLSFVARLTGARPRKAFSISYAILLTAFFVAYTAAATGGAPGLAIWIIISFAAVIAASFALGTVALIARGIRQATDRRDTTALGVGLSYAVTLLFCGASVAMQNRWDTPWGSLVRPFVFMLSNVPAIALLYFRKRASARIPGPYAGPSMLGEPEAFRQLSLREREVALLVAAGKSNAEVGATLFISSRTVDTHLVNIYRKLGVKNRVQLLRMALREPPAGNS
jgi:DNA-binding CsgD family transcriptional regulator